jgi:chromosome segregation ATPase
VTRNATQHFADWQREITDELQQAREALPPIQAEIEAAEVAAQGAEIEYRDVRDRLLLIPNLAEPLALRLAALEGARKAARGRVARARADLEAARVEVAKRENALAQLSPNDTEKVAWGYSPVLPAAEEAAA